MLGMASGTQKTENHLNLLEWLFPFEELRHTDLMHQRGRCGQGDPACRQLPHFWFSPLAYPIDSCHLSLSTLLRLGKPSGTVLFFLAHNIAQGHVGPLDALWQCLPAWSSWVRLPSAWLWWAATPAALPWSSHPRASLSPWWFPAGEAPACSCLSSFPETADTKGQCSSSECIWFCQPIRVFAVLPGINLHTLCFKISRTMDSKSLLWLVFIIF